MKRRFPAQSSLRRVAASVVALSALTLTSACSVFSPVQTNVAYNAADGMPATVGKVALRDLLLVSDGQGSAVLSGSAINEGQEKVTLQFSPQAQDGVAAGGSELELNPLEQVDLASKGLQLGRITAKPGMLMPLAVRSSVAGTTVVNVPILAPTGPYATITPAG